MEAVVNVFGLCVAALCGFLLLRAYSDVGKKLLLWSGLCFAGLAISNAILVADLWIYGKAVDLYTWRLAVAAASMALLVYGLISESE